MALFTPRANTISRVLLVGLLVVPLLLVGTLIAFAHSPLITGQDRMVAQPIPFDHRHHVQDDEIDCLYCHPGAERAPEAGVPSTDACMNCHGQIWPRSPVLAPLRAAWAAGEPIRWKRVHDLPDFVFFDHSIHYAKGVGCVSCHGRVDQMPAVIQARPLTMEWCLECHADPTPHLRPREALTRMDWQPPVDDPQLGRRIAERLDVEPRTNCWSCHR